MTELLGWIGLGLFISTLVPFIRRRLRPKLTRADFFSRRHHALALACLAVVTLHGISALTAERGHGWRHGNGNGLEHMVFLGVLAWLALLTVILSAAVCSRKKPASRVHCLVVIIPVLLTLIHIT